MLICNELPRVLLRVRTSPDLDCEGHISELDKILLLLIRDAISDVDLLLEQNTLDSTGTFDIKQQILLTIKLSLRAVKS
jgi:hypothetical protein